jgi:carboxylate-amine ligase
VNDSNWGSVLTLGAEEELMLVDAQSFAQRSVSSLVLPRVRAVRGVVKHELFASIVEANTGICTSAGEAGAILRELRAATDAAAREVGCTIVAAGSHPFDIPSEQQIADEPEYRRFVEYAGPAARRQGVQGLHVHVGMPDAETCLRVIETIVPWLPLVLALSANSPWLEGSLTGMVSNRAEVLALLPRHGAPPRFESWADWERLVRRMCDAGVIERYTAIHWDVRPHPRFGTLEVRMPDQPTSAAVTESLIELVRALCAWALEQPAPSADSASRVIFDQNRFAASRFGPRATFVHPNGGAAASVPELYAELAQLIGFDGIDPAVCEADLQVRFEDPHAAAADLAARSLA